MDRIYADYSEYLKSEEWRQKARQRMEIDGYRCQMCGSSGTMNNRLQCHHLTYRHLYNEDVWKDLLTLCTNCHKAVHAMMNRRTAPDRHGWKDELKVANHVLEIGNQTEGIQI